MGLLVPRVSDTNRRIIINQLNPQYPQNKVITAKYNIFTFIPKSILLQFLRLSNIVFLVNAVLQSIPIISSLSPITAIGPLIFVLMVSMIREGFQDYKRHKKDVETNSRKSQVLKNGKFEEILWQQIKVGDFVKLKNKQFVPADMLILYTTQQNSICYVETSNLDGESNLKQKFAYNQLIKLYPQQFQKLKGQCVVDLPSSNLYQFYGEIFIQNVDKKESSYVDYDNLLLRQTMIKNTGEVVGLVLYTGYDTKILKNQGNTVHKISRVQTKLNYIQIILVIILVLLCLSCSFGYYLVSYNHNLRSSLSYIPSVDFNLTSQSTLVFFTVFLLLNFLIPISLNIILQGVKTFSGLFLTFDNKMYDSSTQTNCGVLNTSIVEQLGIIDCVLTDKTGTLTCNQMVFKVIAVKDRVFTSEYLIQNKQFLQNRKQIYNFLLSMIICHDIVMDQQKNQIQGSSPDEVCFVQFAKQVGFQFVKRTKTHIQLLIQGRKILYQLIDILSFTSRKRMSVIVKDIMNKQIILFTKGADSAILSNSLKYQHQKELNQHIDVFAKQGLRTLVFSQRTLSKNQLQTFLSIKQQIKIKYRLKQIQKNQYQNQIGQLIQRIQSQLTIIGASGIEDKLQEGVPKTISRLQNAGIIVMMITGDKLQTAQNIGYLSQLIRKHYIVYTIDNKMEQIWVQIQKIYRKLQSQLVQCSLIIQGKQISKIINQENPYYRLIISAVFSKAKSVIFCRSSPKQKASIAKFIKQNLHLVVLAIGDGGNDVGMIQQAHIGIGLIGKQGNSAAAVSDFSFAQFRFLDRLVLHHGRWLYYRLSYFFVFFGWKNVIITIVIYLGNIDNSFSGILNFTQLYYLLYNSFFVVAQTIYFGLYEQDINDDMQPILWKYLPQIYKQSKKKQLFSYKRYFIWLGNGMLAGLILYFIVRLGLSPIYACDDNGRIPDNYSYKIINGINLVGTVMLVCYMDTKVRTYFFQIGIFLFGSIICTICYFLAQNFWSYLGYYYSYSDNFNFRFMLTVFIIFALVFLIKIAIITYNIQFQPSLVDEYKILKLNEEESIDIQMKNILLIRNKIQQENQKNTLHFRSQSILPESKLPKIQAQLSAKFVQKYQNNIFQTNQNKQFQQIRNSKILNQSKIPDQQSNVGLSSFGASKDYFQIIRPKIQNFLIKTIQNQKNKQ